MGKQEYLSAGRFAALVGTTKETLFHYDEIGLFVPKRRGTNGYRYYAMDQMETFDVIGMLRELGMPFAGLFGACSTMAEALALGADAVLIARPFVTMVYGGAEEGVAAYVDKLKAELADTMAMCGARSLADIKRSMLFGF